MTTNASRRTTFLALLVVTGLSAHAGTFTLEQVLSSPFPSGLVAASHAPRIAWVFNAKGARNVWIADGPNFAARQVTRYSGDNGDPIASLRLTPDGHTVVYVRGTEPNEAGRVAIPANDLKPRKQMVWAMDVDGESPRALGEMGCGGEGCEDVEISPDGQFAAWSARKQLWIAPVSGATPSHQLTDLPGSSASPQWSPDGRHIAFVNDRGDHSFIAVYDFGYDSVRYLAPGVDRDTSPRWSPDYMDYYHNAYAMNQYLASQGYVVLSVNYRLGIMYGRAFREAANASWRGGAEYKDIIAAAKYLQTLPTVDARKLGLWGGSYGGYLTAMGLARNSDLFAAGVDFHGVHDWSVFLPRGDNNTPPAPDRAEADKLAFQSSPNASLQLWKSPVLLIQGDDDRNVPFSQTVDLAQRLRENHVPVEVLVFPDEIHDFLMFKTWLRAYGATADFFARTLKHP